MFSIGSNFHNKEHFPWAGGRDRRLERRLSCGTNGNPVTSGVGRAVIRVPGLVAAKFMSKSEAMRII